MAKTYSVIQTITLTSTASSITFSNIPQNYTDLKLVFSCRSNGSTTATAGIAAFNGSTSNFTTRYIYGTGATTVSTTGSNEIGSMPAANFTTSAFSNTEVVISNYTTSNNKSYFVNTATENNATEAYNYMFAGLWSSSAAITSITYSPSTGSFISGSTFTLYGISGGAKATGGTITGSGNYIYHTFTSSGSFIPTEKISNAEVFILSGGGGGGYWNAGGGGAGGINVYTNQTLNAASNYLVIIGSGGAGSTTNGVKGVTGVSSQFVSLTADAGGGGGSNASESGASGASGGGAAGVSSGSSTGGSATNGYSGGAGYAGSPYSGGGGGGSGGQGVAGASTSGGAGGVGISSYGYSYLFPTNSGINGYIAAGGGGAIYNTGTVGQGGQGGGGNGGNPSSTNGVAATANTGSGGGGAAYPGNGGAGGSGLVIIRYPVN